MRPTTRLLLFVLLCVAACEFPGRALAAWSADSLQNLPVCTAAGSQLSPQLATDGAGGAIIAWVDQRGSSSDIYAMHCLASGIVDPAWPANGLAVCTAVGSQFNVCLVSDGKGGAVCAWQDGRGASYDIYAHHVLSAGSTDPAWPADGVVLCAASGDQQLPTIASDDAGGAFVSWQDKRTGVTYDIYCQHVLSTGIVDPVWPQDGLGVCTAAGSQQRPVSLRDHAGGVLIAWQDARADTTGDIYAARIRPSASLSPGWPVDGLVINQGTGAQQSPVMCSDGGSGAVIAWQDSRGGAGFDLYAQHALSGGSLDNSWPAGGQLVSAAQNDQITPSIVSDGIGGAFLAWRDFRATVSFSDVYASHVLPSGGMDPAWPVDGAAVCTATNNQNITSIVQDGYGGCLLAWSDSRSGTSNSDIYAQRLTSAGQFDPSWPPSGRAICKAARLQQGAQAIADGAGGAIIAWTDGRPTNGTTDIYAQRVQSNGQLGGVVVGVDSGPDHGVRSRVWCSFASTGENLHLGFEGIRAGPVGVTIHDVQGRVVERETVQISGPARGEVVVMPRRPLVPGVYLVTAQTFEHKLNCRAVVLR